MATVTAADCECSPSTVLKALRREGRRDDWEHHPPRAAEMAPRLQLGEGRRNRRCQAAGGRTEMTLRPAPP